MHQTELNLSKQDRRTVDEFRARGLHRAREFNRAHILAALDQKIPEPVIMQVLSVGRTAIWRTRAAYLEGGLNFALHDDARPGKPKQYAADAEAQITALAYSAPPPGAQRWTIALLTAAARRHPRMKTISWETIRRALKKTHQALAEGDVVHWRTDRRVPPAHVRTALALCLAVRSDRAGDLHGR